MITFMLESTTLMVLCFKCFPEAAEKAAEQLDGLTVGGDKDGAQGEGIVMSTLTA